MINKLDAVELLSSHTPKLPILVDQGEEDTFLHAQLKPEQLAAAAQASNSPLTLRMHKGYDHSYFFIQSFIDEHLAFHAQHLNP